MKKIIIIVMLFLFVISCSTLDKGLSVYLTAKKILPIMKETIKNDPQLDNSIKEQCLMWIEKYETLFKK